MSEFKIIKQDKKSGNIEKAAIMDAVAFYTKFQQPAVIFDQKDMAKPTHFEWTTELVVDEDTADAYDETSPKQLAKKMTKQQVAKKYKLVDEDGNIDDEKFKEVNLDPKLKKFFVIKKAQQCQTRDGKSLDFLQPRAVKNVEGKNVDITFEELIGNGSKVDLLLRFTHNKTYGTFSYPAIMKVNELIAYEGSGGGSQGLDEDDEDFLGGSVEFAEAPAKAEKPKGGDADEEEPVDDDAPDFGDDPDEEDVY